MYRGGIGQWAYIVHRLTGIGIFLYLLLHIFDTLLVRVAPETFNHLVQNVYAQAWFKPFEILLVATVLYHALNGIRIIVIDFFDIPSTYHRHLFAAAMITFVLLFIPSVYFLVKPVWMHAGGS